MGGLTTRQLKSRLLERRARQGRHNQLKPGDLLQERYEIIGVLGVGGFSSVYKARDMRFANVTRLCAIKEMVNLATDPTLREITVKSFEREASILATLEHPAIPDVYDYFTDGERSYLVLEFIRGKDLDALLAESDKPMDQDTVLKWAWQICEVLAYLHSHKPQPIVFRDLKPSNLMLDVHDRIHIIDFNIAKVFQSDEKHTMMGTEGYSPPEQYRGESSPAGDIYALGASLHHLLTKQDPRMEVPFSFSERPIRAVNTTVTERFEAVILRCLSYNVEDRYADAMAIQEALYALLMEPQAAGMQPVDTTLTPATQAELPAAAKAGMPASAGVRPIWKFKCEDEIRAAPLVTTNLVLVGAYDNNLYALTVADGQFAWKFPASAGIAGMPAAYGDYAFIGSADRHLYCLQMNSGRVHWQFTAEAAIYSSPKARFDHVFFGSDDGNLYAVNVSSGRLAWKASAPGAVRSSPYISDEYVFYGTEAGTVFCLDLAGKTRWQFQAKRAVTSTPCLAEEMVFVGSLDSTVYALDANSGWPVWRFRTNRPVISSPTVHEGVLYVGSADGHLYAIDIFSGRKLWAYQTEGQVSSSPAVWRDAVYFGSTDGNVYCLNLKKGDLRWRFETGGYVISSPNIVDSILYIGSADHHLYALPV